MKTNRNYHFNVEGYTEKYYLDWLEKEINNKSNSNYHVSFDIKVNKNPETLMKTLSNIRKIKVYQVIDYESNDKEHVVKFENILRSMRKASKQKQIEFLLGYSNFTFELWMVLHKIQLKNSIIDRFHYLKYINKAYDTKFNKLDDYKQESNFKEKCLAKLSIDDVIMAINNAKEIRQYNKETHEIDCKEFCKYSYYTCNPSLSIDLIIESILKDCGLI